VATEVQLAVPPDTLDWWGTRLGRYGVRLSMPETRFGERVLPMVDTHGQAVTLVEASDYASRRFTPWEESPVPVAQQIRGLHGARLVERDLGPTAFFLVNTLGFEHVATEGEWHRYAVAGGGSGRVIDLREDRDERRGHWGVGSIHHLAWRVDDDAHEREVRERVERVGMRPTPVIDRFWFKSVYFKEPGGVLFELATDGPGFAVDEDPAHLGETLVLPPWLEPQRAAIERALPRIQLTPTTDG
jgi:glyoxalase family protein